MTLRSERAPAGAGTEAVSADEGRTARKRRAIVAAATEVFLTHGYLGTSMDEVAARAAVSKQTLYKQFVDKEQLFAEVILSATLAVLDELAHAVAVTIDASDDVASALGDLARRFVAGLMRPGVVRLRRLVIAEAGRFPDIGREWYDRGFAASLDALGESLRRLSERGLLRNLEQPVVAAHQFAALVMYTPMNRVMFRGPAEVVPAEELERIAESAVRVFLAAYGPRKPEGGA